MSSRYPLLWLALHRRRRLLIVLTVALAVFEALIVLVARASPPSKLFASEANAVPGLFKALSGSGGGVLITTYPGLLGFGLVHPFWIAMQLSAIGSLAAAVLASDVEAGTIELIMVRPISRGRLLGERVAAMMIALVVMNVAAAAALAVGVELTPQLHQAVPLGRVAVAGVLGFALGLCIAGPAVAVSAAGRRRAQVIAATVTVGAVGFAVNFIALAWSRASSLRYLSPFHYYSPGDTLAHGTLPWGSLAVALAGLVASVAVLTRRDLAP
jgi:ABC-2 type transport system permease protein